MSNSYSEAGMDVPTFNRFRILLRLRRPQEPSSRPPGRPAPGEVEADRHGRKSKQDVRLVSIKGPRSAEPWESQSCDETILGILHSISMINDGVIGKKGFGAGGTLKSRGSW